MRRDHSTAYSIARVRVPGSMKPLTIMPLACSTAPGPPPFRRRRSGVGGPAPGPRPGRADHPHHGRWPRSQPTGMGQTPAGGHRMLTARPVADHPLVRRVRGRPLLPDELAANRDEHQPASLVMADCLLRLGIQPATREADPPAG